MLPYDGQGGRIATMSRAFVREDDGWNFCPAQGDTCMYADTDGTCFRKVCKRTGEPVAADPMLGRADAVE